MLDFRGRHPITAVVEVIPIQKVNEADERSRKADGKDRFSINRTSLRAEGFQHPARRRNSRAWRP